MNLADVMDDLAAALRRVEGLRVYAYTEQDVSPPAAVVFWPDTVAYDDAMTRGADTIALPVGVLVGEASSRAARDQLAAYLDGSGARSVKAAIEGYDDQATAYHYARVATASPGLYRSAAGVDYLSATFTVNIVGRGA